jgi:general secretion pathway protein D
MKPAAQHTLTLAFILALSTQMSVARAQDAVAQVPAAVAPAEPAPGDNPVVIAEEEAVRRQEATIRLGIKLDEAGAAEKQGHLVEAAKRYQEAVALLPFVQIGSAKVDAQKHEAIAGLDRVRIALANRAIKQRDYAEANNQVIAALKADPTNEDLRKLKSQIDKAIVDQQGTVPSPDLVKTIPVYEKQKVEIATLVQDAKLLYEMGKYDRAEAVLKEVLKRDPSNRAAPYYLDLLKEARFADKSRVRESVAKSSMVQVEEGWLPPTKNEELPVPNPMASTNLVYTTPGRQRILNKLQRIKLNEVSYDLPLTEVLKLLKDESRKRDPEGVGINFMINPHSDAAGGGLLPTDTTGAAAAGVAAVNTASPSVDLSQATIKISPPLNEVTMAQVLDAVMKVSDTPIRFSVEDYAVVFSPKPAEPVALYTRVFRVDPNTFIQGLQNVTAINLNFGQQSTGLSAGGGGGSQSGSGGGTSGGQQSAGVNIPVVQIAPVSQGSSSGGGLQQGGTGGQIGLNFVTRTNDTLIENQIVLQYFLLAGVNLNDPGKHVFFNDRTGLLMVRASAQDLDTIETAVEVLNQAPPQVSIETKFASISQEDSKGLGFNWFLGNVTIGGKLGAQAGTAPSLTGQPTTANGESGIFPPAVSGLVPSPTDTLLTSGLRQTVGAQQNALPTLGTLTGILTDPQFRVVVNAIEQRTGSDLLSAPRVTTLSGRQAHVAVQELQEIVTSVTSSQTGAPGVGGIGGVGTASISSAVAGGFSYGTTTLPFGPTLDVLPSVSADGYSIQMTLIPTYTEFVGYDNPGQFVPSVQSVAGSSIGTPLVAVLPLPHFRIRQAATTCNVWDGQTVVLGGMIADTIFKIKDKVPFLGDLPLVGRLFQSQSSDSTKQNLMIFVTPTLIDPAGNRVHTDEQMPFAQRGVPSQSVVEP